MTTKRKASRDKAFYMGFCFVTRINSLSFTQNKYASQSTKRQVVVIRSAIIGYYDSEVTVPWKISALMILVRLARVTLILTTMSAG